MRGGLLVCGTTSDAGKSFVVAGLCRLLARQGVAVAPFKAQNMALNAAVTADGSEIWFSRGSGPSMAQLLLPLLSGSPRPFLDRNASAPSWAPDDTRLVYFQNDNGDPLFIADRTVATHVEHILHKLEVPTRTLAAVRAEREGCHVPPLPGLSVQH